jgi:hypothetical protein
MWFVPKCYKQETDLELSPPCVEAGSDTSTVTLRVAGGDEKGSLKSETLKYGYESKGTRTQERLRWRVPAAYTKSQTRPLVRENAHRNRAVIVRDK